MKSVHHFKLKLCVHQWWPVTQKLRENRRKTQRQVILHYFSVLPHAQHILHSHVQMQAVQGTLEVLIVKKVHMPQTTYQHNSATNIQTECNMEYYNKLLHSISFPLYSIKSES